MAQERIIYDNEDIDSYEQMVREEYAEMGDFCDCDEVNQGQISDEQIMHQVNWLMQEDWDDVESEFNKFFSREHNPYGYLLVGTLGRWDGTHEGGFHFHDMDEFWNMHPLEDCDYIKIYDVNGHLYMDGTHHDGTNYYEIKELTERGDNLLDKWEYDYDDPRSEREIHHVVFNNNLFSKLPHFAHTVYGYPKQQ